MEAHRAKPQSRSAETQKAQPGRLGFSILLMFWLPDLDSNQGPAD